MNTDTIQIPLNRIPMTPSVVAELFWSWDEVQQAQFFNHLGTCVLSTPAPFTKKLGEFTSLDWQMYSVRLTNEMLPLGLRVMEMIGEATVGARLQAYKMENEPSTGSSWEGTENK